MKRHGRSGVSFGRLCTRNHGWRSFDLANLVNTDANQVHIADFEAQLRQQIDQQLLTTSGVRVLRFGTERLTLPSVTLTATHRSHACRA